MFWNISITSRESLELHNKMLSEREEVVAGISVDTSGFDFSDHSSSVSKVKRANITLIILVGVFVCLRIVVRAYMIRNVFVDDSTSIVLRFERSCYTNFFS